MHCYVGLYFKDYYCKIKFQFEFKDECSFVSLRDVERVLQVMSWFFRQSNEDQLLFRRMRGELEDSDSDSETDSDDESTEEILPPQVYFMTYFS